LLWLVPTPIGNIADISLRSLQILQNADIFLCEDTRITKQLLKVLQERYSFNYKENALFIPLHSHNEKEFIEKLSPSFFEKNVVYVSDAGMPVVSDPGALLVAYMQENNIEYDVLPGANAVLTAYVASGFNANQFLFWGFLPHKGKERTLSLNNALYSGYVTILYEAPHRVQKLLKEIASIDKKREIFLAKELTKKYQKYFRATPSEILKKLDGNFRGEWVVVFEASSSHNASAITQKDILSLDIPKKQQAKLISKITGENTKACYQRLLSIQA